MALFLSTHVNKIDKKGRVSVPASFRSALADQSFQGIILFRSANHDCLEGFSLSTMEEIAGRLDHLDFFSDAQDDLATAIFGDSVQLPFDGDGRVVLPVDLMEYAGVIDSGAFVGMGRKFQLWEPEKLARRQKDARDNVRVNSLTIPAKSGDAS